MDEGRIPRRLPVRCLLLAPAAALALVAPVAAHATPEDVLNRYYTLRQSDPDAALAWLSGNVASESEDIRIRLELGYDLLARGRQAEALAQFEAAAQLDPAWADVWRQIGYVRIALDRHGAALDAFERAHALDPSDEHAALQRAYLLQQAGRNRAAAQAFRALSASGDAALARQSCQAWGTLRGLSDKVLGEPWFADLDAAPEYVSQFDIGVLPVALRAGAVLDAQHQVEAYASLRATVDTRSGRGIFGPQIYNDNALVLAAGLRGRPVADFPLQLFAEAGTAHDITDRNRERWRGDLRAGFLYYDEWNMALRCGEQAGGIRPVADLYADGVYYSRYAGNVLFYARLRPGLRLVETGQLAVDAYALGAVGLDTQGVADNRFQELGGGLAFRLFDPLRLNARAEGVRVWRSGGLADYSTARVRVEYSARF